MTNPNDMKTVSPNIVPLIALLVAALFSPVTDSVAVGSFIDKGVTAGGVRVGNNVGGERGAKVGGELGAKVMVMIGNDVGGERGATVVTGNGVGGGSGAGVVTIAGDGAEIGADIGRGVGAIAVTGNGVGGGITVTGNGVGGGIAVPRGADVGMRTGAGTVPPLLSMHTPAVSKPTQLPTKRFEQSKEKRNCVSEIARTVQLVQKSAVVTGSLGFTTTSQRHVSGDRVEPDKQ